VTLTDDEQVALRAKFRDHWQNSVPFNLHCNVAIERWDPDGVTFLLPLRHELTGHKGIFHGGVISALIDMCASGAVIAGHDFTLGTRLTTVTMSVQYLGGAPGEDARAEGVCVRRGRTVSFAEARVHGAESGKLLATGQISVSVKGAHESVRV
jgi:uncharacterized protein (TIGR00369 family)